MIIIHQNHFMKSMLEVNEYPKTKLYFILFF
jgi:hypothetical protein